MNQNQQNDQTLNRQSVDAGKTDHLNIKSVSSSYSSRHESLGGLEFDAFSITSDPKAARDKQAS